MEEQNEVSAGEATRAASNIVFILVIIVVIFLAMNAAMMETLTPLNQQFKAEQTATAEAVR